MVRQSGSCRLYSTELTLALAAHDVDMPLFDTTELHALAAVAFALGGAPWSADRAGNLAPPASTGVAVPLAHNSLPVCPKVSAPQHHTAPAAVTPQV